MGDSDFYKTQMGHRFYEQTMPSLVRELARLNDLLERLVERVPADASVASPPLAEPRR